MKLCKKVIKRRLRKDILFSKNQFGFMLARLTMEAIHHLRKLMGLSRNRKEDLYMTSIDLEKTYEKVPCDVLWRFLDEK